MNTIIDRITTTVDHATSTGRAKVRSVQRERRRQRLMSELGRAYYSHRTASTEPNGDVDDLVAELDALAG